MSPNFNKAIDKSTEVLSSFGVDSPPVPLIDIVTSYGIDIVYANFSSIPKGNEIAGFIDLDRNKIFVNKSDSPSRQRFTIAHEFGHYLLHESYVRDKKRYAVLLRRPLKDLNYSEEEKEANCFAANLLVPNQILSKYKDFPNGIIASLFAVSEDVVKYNRKRNYG